MILNSVHAVFFFVSTQTRSSENTGISEMGSNGSAWICLSQLIQTFPQHYQDKMFTEEDKVLWGDPFLSITRSVHLQISTYHMENNCYHDNTQKCS